jgi:AraC-like DNA-binding protein
MQVESGSTAYPPVAYPRLPAWLLAHHREFLRIEALRALGEQARHVEWTLDPDTWLRAHNRVKLAVCDDLSAPTLLPTVREAARRQRTNVIVLTTDAPERLRLLLTAGVCDALCMPVTPCELAATLVRARSAGVGQTLTEAVDRRKHKGVLRAALRRVLACLEPGTPRPPHSTAALARAVRCSSSYLAAAGRGHGLDLAEVIRCVVLLRAINEGRWLDSRWQEVAERVGYSDETGLAKVARRMLGVGLDRLEEHDHRLCERLTSAIVGP